MKSVVIDKLTVLVGMMVIAMMSANAMDKVIPNKLWERPSAPPLSKISYPLDENMIHLKNYSLNDYFAFVEIPYMDPNNPEASEVAACLDALQQDDTTTGLTTQMRIVVPEITVDSVQWNLYSRRDAKYPIILLSALRTEVWIRMLPTSTNYNITISFSSPIDDNNWGDVPNDFEKFYSCQREGDWLRIYFSPNLTPDYRQVGLTISVRPYNPCSHRIDTKDVSTRHWVFTQLPWTDDVAVLDHIPLVTLNEFLCEDEKNDRPNESLENHPFPQNQVMMKNYSIGNPTLPSFFILPTLDSENPDPHILKESLNALIHSIGYKQMTQMTFASLPTSYSLYSWEDSWSYPIILVSAEGGTIAVRMLPSQSYTIGIIDSYDLRLPDEDGIWNSATAAEQEFYSCTNDGENLTLTFPENRTDNFRLAGLTIRTHGESEQGSSSSMLSRHWNFVQLPWTNDPDIFNRIPLVTRDECYNIVKKSREVGSETPTINPILPSLPELLPSLAK